MEEKEEIKNQYNDYIVNTYNKFDLAIKEGNGATFVDFNDKTYIDFTSGIAVNTFGVNDSEWKNAVISQINEYQHTSNLYYTKPQADLAELLCKKTSAKKVFFSNSGAEANECAIKTARKYGFDNYSGERYEIITLKNSFHGRTMATLSATGQDSMHKFFNPFLSGFKFAEANNISDLQKNITEKTVAVMIELIQGESGVNVLDKNYVKAVEKICHDRDLLLIIDEVQTGNGRCGSLYAFMQFDIKPDIVTTAKGLAGGLPFGATLFFDKTENVLQSGQHGSTFGGNPVCAAAALSVLKRLDKQLFLEVQGKSEYIKTFVLRMKKVKSVSGMGLMLGLEIEGNARETAEKCLEKGLIVLTAKNKIRLLPPLNITKTEIESGLQILNEVLN